MDASSINTSFALVHCRGALEDHSFLSMNLFLQIQVQAWTFPKLTLNSPIEAQLAKARGWGVPLFAHIVKLEKA